MSEPNDFSDELNDDDDGDTDTQSYFDDDDDEDNEPADIRTAVLAKGDLLALITLATTSSSGRITRYDPRDPVPTTRRYDTAKHAATWFRSSLSTSVRNGWNVVYDGEPLCG